MGIAGCLWRVAEALFRRPEGGHSVRTGVFHALFSTAARWHSWPCCRRPFALPRLLGSSGRAGTGCLSAIVHANPGRRAGAVRKEPNTPTGRSAVTPAASLLGLAIAQATGAARAREHLSNPGRRQCPVEGGGAGASHGHQHSHAHCEHVILIAFTLLGSEPVHEETELIDRIGFSWTGDKTSGVQGGSYAEAIQGGLGGRDRSRRRGRGHRGRRGVGEVDVGA